MKWNDYGVFFDLGQSKGGHALPEHADHRKRQLSHAEIFADRVFQAEHAFGEFPGDQANFASRFHVSGIEVPAAQDHQAANGLVSLGNSNQRRWPRFAIYDDGHRDIVNPGHFHHAGDRLLHLRHIIQSDFIAEGLGLIRGADQFSPHQV